MTHIILEDIDTHLIRFLPPDPEYKITTILSLSAINKKFHQLLAPMIEEWIEFIESIRQNCQNLPFHKGQQLKMYAQVSIGHPQWITKHYLTPDLIMKEYIDYFKDIFFRGTLENLEYFFNIICHFASTNESFKQQWNQYVTYGSQSYIKNNRHILNEYIGDHFCHKLLEEQNTLFLLNTSDIYFPKDNLNINHILIVAVNNNYLSVVAHILNTDKYDRKILSVDFKSCVKNICGGPSIEHASKGILHYNPDILELLESKIDFTYDFRPYAGLLLGSYPHNAIVKYALDRQAKRNEIFDEDFIIRLMREVCFKTADQSFLEWLVMYCMRHSYNIKSFNKQSDILVRNIQHGSVHMIKYIIQLRDQYYPTKPYKVWDCFCESITDNHFDRSKNIQSLLEYFISVDPISIRNLCGNPLKSNILLQMIKFEYNSDDVLYLYIHCKDQIKHGSDLQTHLMEAACEYGHVSVLKYMIEVEKIHFDLHTLLREILYDVVHNHRIDMWNYLVELSINGNGTIDPIVLRCGSVCMDAIMELRRLLVHTKGICSQIRNLIEHNGPKEYVPALNKIVEEKELK